MAKKTKAARHQPQARKPGESTVAHAGKQQPRASRVDIALRVLTALGVLLTAYLTWVASSGGGAAFCTEGSACDVVQSSQWSRLLGAPIALWGLGLYAVLAWLAWRPGSRVLRWRRMWRLSFLGLAISVYLTLAGWVALQALCGWCLLSLATMAAIFIVLQATRPDGAPGVRMSSWLLGNGLIALGLLAVLHVSASGLMERRGDPRLHGLAEHLERSGVKYYGASWCANCREQTRKFAGAAGKLPYVECSPNGRTGGVAFECVSERISGYPTWVIGGRHYVEVIEPERLAAMTGYDWDGSRGE
ncbi:Vitamin K epoxide reductase [Luteimonas aestuarii]|uniref:Vitamin K epoxide reductase n=1 Tax=Luteimonas aestuarii TaxID=453837 RepID=A0A4R5TSK8_9GAMM|nr:vitamin K epoxide reductase family protein [Luteimonas aestuarii]TDK18861.1 Vitamin K epoxide reductase [Luteimonas aestuarii]